MSSHTVGSLGGGKFEVVTNGKTEQINLADLNMLVRMEQVHDLNNEIATHLAGIQADNQKRDALNQLLERARTYQENGWDDDSSRSFSLEGYSDRRTFKGWELLLNNGKALSEISTGVNDAEVIMTPERRAEWDKKITDLKDLIDNVASDVESKLIKFRQVSDKRAVAIQDAKTTLAGDKRLREVIAQSV